MNFSTKDECITHLNENYHNPAHPIAFSGVTNIYKYYKGFLKPKEIEKILSSFDAHTLRREYKNLKRNPNYSHFKRYQFQVDLIDIQKLSKWNDQNKYILSVIDTFSRKAWVRTCKDKSSDEILNAFKSILTEAKTLPHTLVSDRGKELTNKKFLHFCVKNGIKFFHNYTSVHAPFIERFNRTFQNILYKFMDHNETKRYIDNLQDFVDSYNGRTHRIIDMTPDEAENDLNNEKINSIMTTLNDKLKKEKPKYLIDQKVRISLHKGAFHRGYKEQSNQEVFNIYKIKTNLPKPLYLLETHDKKEKLIGGFYSHEITPVNSDVFKVEKVLKKRKVKGKVQYFVKWKGYDSSNNSWIDEKDITNTYNG
jgi:transposase InsO family protein